MRPHRRQPTRLPHPWDSPGKNTGVGYHFLLQCMKVKSEREVAQWCLTLHDPMDCSLPGSSAHGIFRAKSTGVGCHCLLCEDLYCTENDKNTIAGTFRLLFTCFMAELLSLNFLYTLHPSYNFSFPTLFFPSSSDGKASAYNAGDLGFDPWVWKIPWRRTWQPTPVFMPGKSHGPRSLVGYNPWNHKESDATERLLCVCVASVRVA